MQEPSPNRGLMVVLAYLWPLALVPLLLERQDPEVQWHAKHGLVLMAAEVLLMVFMTVAITAVSYITIAFGCALSLGVVFAWVAILGVHVAAMVKALNGGRLIIPAVSLYTDRF
jgi:uncharacterized membrane protein